MLSTPARRVRSAFLALGTALGLSGFWMAVPDLLSPKSIGLPFDRDTADSAAAHRTGALVAAELGLVRGDLWTKAAFTGAPFLWTAHPANLDPAELKQLARVRNTTETALALAPINGAAWLFLAKLPATSPETESRIGTLLEMSYFTAPSAPDLALPRIQRAVSSSALANKDLQNLRQRRFARDLAAAGRNFNKRSLQPIATPCRRIEPIFESLIADADPAAAQMLHSNPPK